jgi:hypothetical protein
VATQFTSLLVACCPDLAGAAVAVPPARFSSVYPCGWFSLSVLLFFGVLLLNGFVLELGSCICNL